MERSSRHYLSLRRQGVDNVDMRLILSLFGFVYSRAVGTGRGRGVTHQFKVGSWSYVNSQNMYNISLYHDPTVINGQKQNLFIHHAFGLGLLLAPPH